ncbi:lysoplasmalogenase [Portibacter lacus]|uniref:Membrane protein n=1 Tax=Portibacter lacus TaxID=1099794 RepID=A0AA37WIA6_9BACT|nr:lysoplasmalogenase [Portibacter lacus]GLR19515.1 membrane protein [Portibacter lacus]
MISRRLLNILVFISAAVSIYLDLTNNHNLYVIFKPITTILVLLIPILHGNKVFGKYRNLTIIALVFCLIGDVFLLEDSRFVLGLGSFLIAHVLFTWSFVTLDKFNFNIPVMLGFLAFGIGYYAFIYSGLGAMAIPVFAYVLFILTMGWQSTSLFLKRKEFVFKIMAIGAACFIFSDAMIALNKFKFAFEMAPLVILASYWLAIVLLANAACLISEKQLVSSQTLT